ncbi:MAG: prolyl oligopeptidase family serine peptidase [Anaerolineae bacterium]|nr:prolyl oligopeptidase family serine peptidase [Anaerolineae bacterium]
MTYQGGCDAVTFGNGLIGVLYTAAGDLPCPTAILLHGIPGSEKNVDIAYRLRDLGWHALIVHFAGTWGSGGSYDITQQPADAIAALEFLLTADNAWQVDPQRIAIIGSSLGARAALVAAYRDPRVTKVVTLGGISDFDEVMLSDTFFTNASAFLHGVDGRAIKRQWAALGGADNPITLIGKLTQAILIVQGTDDDVIPLYNGEALHQASHNADFVRIEGADHIFTRHRTALVEAVTEWLLK